MARFVDKWEATVVGDEYLRSCNGCDLSRVDERDRRCIEMTQSWMIFDEYARSAGGNLVAKFAPPDGLAGRLKDDREVGRRRR